jgi:acetyl esterase/lipase
MARHRVLTGLFAVAALLLAISEPAPAVDGDSLRVIPNIPYAAARPAHSRGHLLDLYLPGRPAKGRRPLLIVMGGSGWYGDNGKAYASALAPFFTAAGFVVAGVSTRSSSQAVFPAQVHDVKAAIRWLRAHARDFGIDPRRVAVLGDSSGGWTATMAGLTSTAPPTSCGWTSTCCRARARRSTARSASPTATPTPARRSRRCSAARS